MERGGNPFSKMLQELRDFSAAAKPHLKGLSHETEMGKKLLYWIDLSSERSQWWFLNF
jgi:hypothetical protein